MSLPSSLLDYAADVARNLGSADAYDQAPGRARTALRRRAPGFSNEQYDAAMQKAVRLFAAARRIADENEAELMRLSQTKGTDWQPYAGQLRDEVRGFPLKTYRWMMGWVVFWYHLK